MLAFVGLYYLQVNFYNLTFLSLNKMKYNMTNQSNGKNIFKYQQWISSSDKNFDSVKQMVRGSISGSYIPKTFGWEDHRFFDGD
jgi:Ni,Fe-hydrogenase I large subunit